MRIGLVCGFWGQNIGNAFFNLGGEALLRRVPSIESVKLVQDQPSYATGRNERKGNYDNAFDLIAALDVDAICVQGPLFTRNFGNIWRPTLERLRSAGTPWFGVGTAFRTYVSSELASVSEVIDEYPPLFLASRDTPSADYLKSQHADLPVFDGIDSAFALPWVIDPPKLRQDRAIVCLTFDHAPEPVFTADPQGVLEVSGRRYGIDQRQRLVKFAQSSKPAGVLAKVLVGQRRTPFDATVLRPNHRTNPHLPAVIYQRANAIASDEPWTYCTAYSNADLTLSDRVHACVASLAYGRRAMFFNTATKRSALLARVGAERIFDEPVTVARKRLDQELTDVVEFVEGGLDP